MMVIVIFLLLWCKFLLWGWFRAKVSWSNFNLLLLKLLIISFSFSWTCLRTINIRTWYNRQIFLLLMLMTMASWKNNLVFLVHVDVIVVFLVLHNLYTLMWWSFSLIRLIFLINLRFLIIIIYMLNLFFLLLMYFCSFRWRKNCVIFNNRRRRDLWWFVVMLLLLLFRLLFGKSIGFNLRFIFYWFIDFTFLLLFLTLMIYI